MPQRIPPVHSPLPLRALLRGARAAASGGERERAELRTRLRERYGCRRALLADSGTSALGLALRASLTGDDPGAVALPAYSCYDLVTALRSTDARAVLYDLDPGTLAPDPTSLSRALDRGARVVVVVHLYGIPVDLSTVGDLVRDRGAVLVEDAAQGVGARLHGRPLGSWGSLSILSFGRGKGLSGGGGGALLALDMAGVERLEALPAAMRDLPDSRGMVPLVKSVAQTLFARPGIYAFPASLPFLRLGETVYRPPHPPEGIPASCAGTVLGAWTVSLRAAEARRSRAAQLFAEIQRSSGVRAVAVPEAGVPGYLRLPVLARSAEAARRLSSRRARRLGIMPGYPRTLDDLPALPEREPAPPGEPTRDYPGARSLTRRLFTLPVHQHVSRRHAGRIIDLIR